MAPFHFGGVGSPHPTEGGAGWTAGRCISLDKEMNKEPVPEEDGAPGGGSPNIPLKSNTFPSVTDRGGKYNRRRRRME